MALPLVGTNSLYSMDLCQQVNCIHCVFRHTLDMKSPRKGISSLTEKAGAPRIELGTRGFGVSYIYICIFLKLAGNDAISQFLSTLLAYLFASYCIYLYY